VATLWSINDEVSSKLVAQFYSERIVMPAAAEGENRQLTLVSFITSEQEYVLAASTRSGFKAPAKKHAARRGSSKSPAVQRMMFNHDPGDGLACANGKVFFPK
jgi:hypothetical protein